MNKSSKDISPVYDRDNICLFAVLKNTSIPDSCFIVANTHLLFNSGRGDVKLGQVYQVLSTLDGLKKNYGKYNILIHI
jgi:hypothetical protein